MEGDAVMLQTLEHVVSLDFPSDLGHAYEMAVSQRSREKNADEL